MLACDLLLALILLVVGICDVIMWSLGAEEDGLVLMLERIMEWSLSCRVVSAFLDRLGY